MFCLHESEGAIVNMRALYALLFLLSTCHAGPEDVDLHESIVCYVYVPKRVVLGDELPLFEHPIRLPCLMTGQDYLDAFSRLADDLEVGFDEPVREAVVEVVHSTCGTDRGFCETQNWEFWNRFDENTFETYVQPGHSLGTYLAQLEELLAERYRLYEDKGCFSHGISCQLSVEKQVELMIKAAALKMAGFEPDIESIAQSLHQ